MPAHVSRRLAGAALITLAACTDITAPAPGPLAIERAEARVAVPRPWITTHERSFTLPVYLDCLAEEVLWRGTIRYYEQWLLKPYGTLHVDREAFLLPGSTLTAATGTWLTADVLRRRGQYVVDDVVVPLGDAKRRGLDRLTWQHAANGALMDVWLSTEFLFAGTAPWPTTGFDDQTCTLR